MIKKTVLIILICFAFGMSSVSCSPDDDLIEATTQASGDEVDDPVEPDREDGLGG